MKKQWAVVLVLGAALWLPAQIGAQSKAPGGNPAAAPTARTGQGLEAQKSRLDLYLQQRIAEIEKRFAEEQGFRVKMKNERLGFEQKLVQERKAFLDSIQGMAAQERQAAWSGFFKTQRQKRDEFNSQRRAESKKFWEARALKRQSYGKPVQNGAAH